MKGFIGGSKYIVWINQGDGEPPIVPLEPGPLDFTFDDLGLTESSVTYELANPTATLGVAYIYTNEAHVPYATHGGEDLELVYVQKNTAEKKAAALFLGNGLTTEEAELVFGVDAGFFGPAIGRVNDEYDTPKKVVFAGGVSGTGASTASLQVTGFTGAGYMKSVYAGGGRGRVYGMFPSDQELLYVGAGLAGTKQVLDMTEMTVAIPADFVVTETRVEHKDVSTQSAAYIDVAGTGGMAVGFNFKVEIETDEVFKYAVQAPNLSSIRNIQGPFSGEIRDAILLVSNYQPNRVSFYAPYEWAIEDVEIWPVARHVHGAFGKNDSAANNSVMQFRLNYSSPYAVAVMVLQDDAEFGVLNRDGKPLNRDGDPMWDEQ